MIYFVGNKGLFDGGVFVEASIEDCLNYFKNHKEIQLDTETTGFDSHTSRLLTVQLGDSDNQWVIDCTVNNVLVLKDLLESDRLFLLQNAKFDLKFFMVLGINIRNVYDTFLAECILTTGLDDRELGLDALASKYCNVVLDKSIRGNIHREGLTSRVIKYAADDVKCLQIIRDKQMLEITKHNLNKVLWLENEVVKVFARMELVGVCIDSDKWLKVAETTEANVISCEKELDNILLNEVKLSRFHPKFRQGNLFDFEERLLDINWSSNSQKLSILKTLFPEITSVGDRILQRNKKKHPIIPKLIEYTKNEKLVTSFGKKFLKFVNKKTGRIHCNIWQILSTGRISVSEPNLNQIPSKGELGKQIRACFIPQKGYKMVGGDFSGMELRIIAEFSQDPLWVDAFNKGLDLHTVLCCKTFEIDESEVKKEPSFKLGTTYRDIQKIVNFGLAYGMSKFKLSDTVDISVEEADKVINSFFKAVPKVKEFLDLLGNLGKQRGYIKTGQPFGRIRWFQKHSEAIKDKGSRDSFKVLGEIERASKNMPIQGSNGDIIKLALIKAQEEIDKNDWPVNILLSVYDEIQTECYEPLADKWKVKLDEIMVEAAKEVVKTIPIVVDCKVSDCWTK